METSAVAVPDAQVPELLRALAEQASEYAFILMDASGKIIWWNAGAEKILGFPSEQVLGQPSAYIFTPEDRQRGIPELELEIARRDAIAEDDRWHLRADGSRFWSSGALISLRNAEGALIGFGKLIRDRTKLKEQLELLRREGSSAREAKDNQKVGIATLAHELRNVIAVFKHGIKLVRTQGESAERRRELLDMMDEQTAVLHRLTEDLLDVSRIGVGKLQLELSSVVLQELVTQVVNRATARAKEKRISVDLLAPAAPISLNADSTRLQQVFSNLLDNAIKYTPEGGRVWVKVSMEEPEALVHIEDTGIGIPPDMLDKIFDLFTQVGTPGSRHGLGIGLSLVKNLVALHGGSVQARSSGDGKGSEFTVRLPL
jgi:PAS domain S-box-containing protein